MGPWFLPPPLQIVDWVYELLSKLRMPMGKGMDAVSVGRKGTPLNQGLPASFCLGKGMAAAGACLHRSQQGTQERGGTGALTAPAARPLSLCPVSGACVPLPSCRFPALWQCLPSRLLPPAAVAL